MNIQSTASVYFSATGNTAKIAKTITDKLGGARSIDVTDFSQRETSEKFSSNDLVVFGAPVFGGRIPACSAERFSLFIGDNTPAIVFVSYGNREYEDALIELCDIVCARGFIPVAAAAFVAEHSIMREFAAGRPDKLDIMEIESFSKRCLQRLNGVSSASELPNISVKGNREYREYATLPLTPSADSKCTSCGTCAQKCPVGAIPADAPKTTNAKTCISCMRCVSVCPNGARSVSKLKLSVAKTKLRKALSSAKANELFF